MGPSVEGEVKVSENNFNGHIGYKLGKIHESSQESIVERLLLIELLLMIVLTLVSFPQIIVRISFLQQV